VTLLPFTITLFKLIVGVSLEGADGEEGPLFTQIILPLLSLEISCSENIPPLLLTTVTVLGLVSVEEINEFEIPKFKFI
jgi:hypothetical protein